MSLEVGLKKIRLILLEDYLVLLLGLGDPRFKWMFSELDLLRKVYRFICDWEYKFFTARGCELFLCIESFSVDFRYVHLFRFLNVRDQDVSFPDSSRVQRISKENTWQDFWTELMQSRQVFHRNKVTILSSLQAE